MKNSVILLALLSIILVTNSKPLNPKKVLQAINCGAPSPHRGPSGIYYEKDVQSDPETVVADYTINKEVASQVIKYTREPDIYMSERHAYKSFSYKVSIQKEGTYVLILKFAEMYFKDKGKRVFNIKFGQRTVVEGLDIVEKVGKFAAHDEYIEFEFRGGEIYFKGIPCLGALSQKQLVFTLEKTRFDNPYIHGIVLYSGTLAESDYEDRQELIRNWEKIHAQEERKKEEERQKKIESKQQKRKEKIKVRNDHLNELEEFEQSDTPVEVRTTTRTGFSPRALIMSPIGVAALWVAFGVLLMTLQRVFKDISQVPYVPINNEDEYQAPKEKTKTTGKKTVASKDKKK